ncbi:MAG TPA: hypothetical protein VH024_00245 [Candidatus Angelobacter sp.]|jgi:hypothetical protein|nr:hypothetical protein [Candidatus Angelobacter sp.]
MYLSKRKPAMGNWFTDIFVNDWNYYVHGQAPQTPLTPDEKQALVDAKVRASGIDPATSQPIAPQYAPTIQQIYGVDPNDPRAMSQLVQKIRTQESQQIANDFTNFNNDGKTSISPVAIALGIAGVTLAGVWALK